MKTWKVIPSQPNYEASNTGEIRHIEVGKIKSQHKNNRGYLQVGLKVRVDGHKKKQTRLYQVHRLVMEAFCGASDLTVNHKNLNKEDNRLENLEYMSARDNCAHADASGAFDVFKKKVVSISKDGNLVRGYDSIAEAERAIGLHGVGGCLNRRDRTCGGYLWQEDCVDLYLKKPSELKLKRKPKPSSPVRVWSYYGDLVGEYESAKIATADGWASQGAISQSARTGKYIKGYRYTYA